MENKDYVFKIFINNYSIELDPDLETFYLQKDTKNIPISDDDFIFIKNDIDSIIKRKNYMFLERKFINIYGNIFEESNYHKFQEFLKVNNYDEIFYEYTAKKENDRIRIKLFSEETISNSDNRILKKEL